MEQGFSSASETSAEHRSYGVPGLVIGHTDVVQRATEQRCAKVRRRSRPGLLPDIMDSRLVFKTVRVFLSSTFTDTRIDRNALMEEVFDPIRDLCQEHGIAFEVVDLRWGIRQQSVDDHRIINICMEEIKRCQDTSLGIAFMAILGDKYGWRPLPPSIVAQDLEALLAHIDQPNREIIAAWYLKDDNSLPSSYLLQPISKQFPVQAEDKDVRSQAWRDWGQVEKSIWKSLRSASEFAELQTTTKEMFTMSVTHMEVEKGVLQENLANEQALVVDRRFERINQEDEAAADFIDVQDKQCSDLISDLKEKHIPLCLEVDSVLKFSNLQWYREGLTTNKHGMYIKEMCSRVKELLTARIEEVIEMIGPANPLQEEITRHALFCRDHVQSFEGRADILRDIHDYVSKEDPMTPLVLHGESGVGKTTLVAKATMEIRARNANMAVLYRFCGTTPQSSTGRELTLSLCHQIQQVYNIPDEIPEDYPSVCETFPALMAHVSHDKPLCILIDSLDQLTDENGARRFLEWLPRRIPAHVRLIVSTLPEEGGCFERVKTFGISDENFVQVNRLDPADGAAILDNWLCAAKRKLTPEQKDMVLQAFEKCPLPLYMQLMFNDSRSWPSYRNVSEISLQPDVVSMIDALYEQLERYHGKALVSRVLGLLAAVSDGVNEGDILHMLSCDDQLLNDVLVWHQPPKRRLPPLLLARLKYDLGPFLVERGAHGVSLLALYHRQFSEVAATRYLSGKDYKTTYHSIAKYYSGQYHIQYGKERAIPAQPIAYSADALNVRKLELLPKSLMEARKFEELRNWLGDLEMIQAKCMAGLGYDMMAECSKGVQYVLEEDADEQVVNDLENILRFLRSEVHIIEKTPILTFQQAINYPNTSWIGRAAERMLEEFSQSDDGVLPRPDEWVEWINKPEVSEAFEFELGGHTDGVLATCFSRDDRKILSASEDCTIRIWDSQTGSLLAQLDGHTGAVTSLEISPDGSLIASSSADCTIRLWDYKTDKCIRLFHGHKDRVTSVAFNGDGTKLLSASVDQTLKIWDVVTGEERDTLLGHTGHPLCCAWSPVDDGIAASCGDELELFIWDLNAQRVKYKLEGHKIDEAMINFPNKKKLGGHEKFQYNSLIWSVDFSKNGTMLASTGTDSNVFVWNVDSGQQRCMFTIPNDGSAVRFVESSHGTHLAAASAPHMTITLFDVGDNPRTIAVLGGHSGWVMDVGFTSDGSRLTSASRDKKIRVWDINAAQRLGEIRFHSERCWSVAFSEDGHWLASASDDFKVCIWNMKTYQHVLVYEGHEKKRKFSCGVRACTFSRDASLVASGGDEMKIRVWSRETGQDKIVLPCESILLPWCIRFSSDDRRLIAVGEFAKGVLVWDLETETMVTNIGGHELFCQYTEFSPSGNFIISSSVDNCAKVWNAETFDHVVTLEHPDWVTCAAFSHDEKMIATCSRDLKVRLWSVGEWREIVAMEGHTSEVRMVSFSPDDAYVASAALDQSIRVWNVSSHALVHVFYAASGVWGMMWHPTDMDLLAVGDSVGYLYFLKLKSRDGQSKSIRVAI